jgi:hypothetical protein
MSEIGVELLAMVLVFELAVGALVYVRGCYCRLLTRIESLPGFIRDALNLLDVLRPSVPLEPARPVGSVYRLSRRDVAKDHPRQY